MPCRAAVIGGAPPSAEIKLCLAAAHIDEVLGRDDVDPVGGWNPCADGFPVEREDTKCCQGEYPEEDPSVHIGRLRRDNLNRDAIDRLVARELVNKVAGSKQV